MNGTDTTIANGGQLLVGAAVSGRGFRRIAPDPAEARGLRPWAVQPMRSATH